MAISGGSVERTSRAERGMVRLLALKLLSNYFPQGEDQNMHDCNQIRYYELKHPTPILRYR